MGLHPAPDIVSMRGHIFCVKDKTSHPITRSREKATSLIAIAFYILPLRYVFTNVRRQGPRMATAANMALMYIAEMVEQGGMTINRGGIIDLRRR
jgi:hypothetical protein